MNQPRFSPSLPQGAFTWESQVRQYPVRGEPGIGYFAGAIPGKPSVDCLLYRDDRGFVIGILNHYPVDYPPWEKAGNVNVWVKRQNQRQGIATALVEEAMRRWPLDFDQQRYTESGAAFAEHFVARKGNS